MPAQIHTRPNSSLCLTFFLTWDPISPIFSLHLFVAIHRLRCLLPTDELQKDLPKAEAAIFKHKVSKQKLKGATSRLAKDLKKKKTRRK